MNTTLKSIATGMQKKYTLKEKHFYSAYKKDQFLNHANITKIGLSNDVQVDTKFHGGIDKAIHIGSTKHFKLFEEKYSKILDPLAIGCNIFIDDFMEDETFIGDIYSIGEVLIEVSQPRQPCWKVGALFGKEVSRYISKDLATGWYVRVLKEGNINISDTIKLEKRTEDISIKELSNYLLNPPKNNQKLINKILSIPSLAKSYKDDFEKLLTNG